MSLDSYRARIDEIDRTICAQFQARMDTARAIALYKEEHGLPVLNGGREQEVILKTSALLSPEIRPYGARLFHTLMGLSKDYQKSFIPPAPPRAARGKVGFQGVEGSFSHEALEAFFGRDTSPLSYRLFEDLVKAVSSGEVSYGMLPIENSSTGAVNEVYDLLGAYKLSIVGEKIIPIRQNLLGLPGAPLEGIRKAHSHLQGLAQSSRFLNAHPHIQPVEATNTAAAARLVAETRDPSLAAIASLRAGEIYGLEVLAADIHNSGGNSTRFVVVAAHPPFGGEGLQPPFGGEGLQPPFGGEGLQPPFGGEGLQPPFGGEGLQPPFGGEGSQPPFGGEGLQPPFGGEGLQPPFGGEGLQPPFGGEGLQPPFGGGPSDKISTCFTLHHKPGALCSVLKVLEEYGLNMTKLESRPMGRDGQSLSIRRDGQSLSIQRDGQSLSIRRDGQSLSIQRDGQSLSIRRDGQSLPIQRDGQSSAMPEQPWEYIFYLDFEAPLSDRTREALARIQGVSSSFTLLGAYLADRNF